METETVQIFQKMGTLEDMREAMFGFNPPLEFWVSIAAWACEYFQWLKATLHGFAPTNG